MMSGPLVCVTTTGVGVACPHQFVKVSVVELNVEVPHESESFPVVLAPTDGLKLLGV